MSTRPAARSGFRPALPALKQRRETLGLSRRQLAFRIGDASDSTVARIERGALRASPARQATLARELRTPVDDLFAPLEPPPLAERDALIVADYRKLRSAYKVAERHGLEVTTVYRVLELAGVARRDRVNERSERLTRLAEVEASGVPRGELPKRLGVSKTQLYRDLREAGYPHRRGRPDLTEALTRAHAETQTFVLERMDECGWVDIDGVAEILKLTRVGAYGWLRARGVRPVETVPAFAGRARALYDPRAITAEVRTWLQELVNDVWRGDPWRAARWYDHRFGRTVMHGRLAGQLARNKVGAPRDKVTDEKLATILKLDAERRPDGRRRHSQQAIARIVGVSRATVRHHVAAQKTG